MEYVFRMSRPNRSDPFTVLAEPRRRRILEILARDERSVGELVRALRVRQPLASKDLRLLRDAGLVRVRKDGRRRLYRLNAPGLKPVHDWITPFERAWSERFDRLDEVLDEIQGEKR